jgi:hypothetical protein
MRAVEVSLTYSRVVLEKKRKLEKLRGWKGKGKVSLSC